MNATGAGHAGLDLGLTVEMNRDKAAQERMGALQMVLDMHARGLPVIITPFVTPEGTIDITKCPDPKAALAAVHEATKKWQKYIFDGQAIG